MSRQLGSSFNFGEQLDAADTDGPPRPPPDALRLSQGLPADATWIADPLGHAPPPSLFDDELALLDSALLPPMPPPARVTASHSAAEPRNEADDEADDDDDDEFRPPGARRSAKSHTTTNSNNNSNNTTTNNNNNSSSSSHGQNTSGGTKRKRAAGASPSQSQSQSQSQSLRAAGDGKRRVVAANAQRVLSLSLEHGDVTASARDTLASIEASAREAEAAVARLRGEVGSVAPASGGDEAKARASELLAQLAPLDERIGGALREIAQLCATVVLRPEEFSVTQHLRVQFKIHSTTLGLFRRELTFLSKFNQSRVGNCLALVIYAQPFPMSYMYRKRVQEETIVKLLTGAHANFLVGECTAHIVTDGVGASSGGAVSSGGAASSAAAAATTSRGKGGRGGGGSKSTGVDNGSASFDNEGNAVFSLMSFKSGSRKLPIRLQFKTLVEDGERTPGAKTQSSFELVSELTEPFVVMTHENQWVETVGQLLRTDLFGSGSQSSVTWQRFSNVFQHHVLRTTRQDPDHPKRPLQLAELEHFHKEHFNKRAQVDGNAVDKFWAWFGPALNRLHFKRHMSTLWADGVIAGFMSRSAAERALEGKEPGSFLIRFSDSRAGQLVISYVPKPSAESNESVVHFLVQPHFSDERSFPDSLRDWDHFTTVLKVPTHSPGAPMTRERRFESVQKAQLISQLTSSKLAAPGEPLGYKDAPV